MNKTPEHLDLDRRVQEAQEALRAARAALTEAYRSRRAYRAANPSGSTSKVGSELVAKVRDCLCVHRRKNVPTIRKELGLAISHQAVRTAVLRLVREGHARRIGFQGQRWWVYAVAEQR